MTFDHPPVVDAAWLATRLDDAGVVVADVRWSVDGGTPAAEAAFADGHIPGAVFVDVDRDLAAAPFVDGPGRHPLPTPETFAATMRAIGIGDDTVVVAYDDGGGSLAARLWWMLDATGHPAAILNGGLPAWAREHPLQVGPPPLAERATFTARPWPAERLADAGDVAAALDADGVVVDVRAAERFRGTTEPIDPVPGHIPGARNLPWTDHLDPVTGLFLPPDVLRERYASVGVHRAGDAIVHCGSGITGCLGLLALRVAGLGDARLYQGSWSDWVHEPTRPVATGASSD
ncbi:MAG TPA: sulfurtransferase [Actinomycetota bacterium]|nr:sulfurtransferase [Actinomycetota bacterium]